jgi:xanthine/uracil permease
LTTVIWRADAEVLSCIAVPVVVFGFQHYISMLGSIILVPLVMVPAMGGSVVSS